MKTTKDYTFGNLITSLRTERGFSQFQLGHLLGVSDKAVSKWENGNAKPRIGTCYKLADILGVSLDELLSPSGKRLFPAADSDSNPDEDLPNRVAEEKSMSIRTDSSSRKRVELHMRTGMSASDGIVTAYDLSNRTAEWGMPAVAITDFCNTRAFPQAVSSWGKRLPQKIIFGCEGFMTASTDAPIETGVHVMLLVRNREGLVNLNKLVSLSYTKYYAGIPCMPKEIIEQHRDGLLIGSSCDHGEVIQLLKRGASSEELASCVSFYDYLEVQPVENDISVSDEDEPLSLEALREFIVLTIQAGSAANVPVVAVSNGRYLDPEDSLSRAVLQYSDGLPDADIQPPYYLRTTNEMLDAFVFLGQALAEQIVVDASIQLANLIDDHVDLFPPEIGNRDTALPEIPGAEQQLRALALEAAHKLYGENLPDVVSNRLEKEMNFIATQNGWPILEIARLAVEKSLETGYPVFSRGTVGSSLVAHLVGVTTVNPLPPHYLCDKCHYTLFTSPINSDCGIDLPEMECPRCGKLMKRDGFNIPAETFFGIDGKRQMDIDLNFSGEVQSSVHDHIRNYFGPDHVFRPGTISGIWDKHAKEYAAQYAEDHQLSADSPDVKRASDQISYTFKSTGQHPGGLFIVPQSYDVNDFVPVEGPANDSTSAFLKSHYDFNSMHDRLLKMDFLGHDDPTMLKFLKHKAGVVPKYDALRDDKVISLFRTPNALGLQEKDIFSATGTLGVPEFGNTFARHILQAVMPESVEDLIRVSGLAHGTDVWVDNVQNILRDHVASLYDCPSTRDDITNYLTRMGMPFNDAFSLSEHIRKGKFAWSVKPEMQTALQKAAIPEWYISSCRKIKYLFPRAHAVPYVLNSIKMAWYKLYYPAAFYEVWFSVRGDSLEKTDLSMNIVQLRKLILSTRTELQSFPAENEYVFFDSSYEKRSQLEQRMLTLMLLLEMKLRGYELPDDIVQP